MSSLPAASTRRAVQARVSSVTDLPPGPTSSPLVQTYRYARTPLALLEECAARYGEIFTLRLLGSRPWVVLSSPALVNGCLGIHFALFEVKTVITCESSSDVRRPEL